MIQLKRFDPTFSVRFSETNSILQLSGLRIHPWVSRIVLHGSRGPAATYRPDSDIDLSLIVSDQTPPLINAKLEQNLRDVYDTTFKSWRGAIELDLAVIFPLRPCGLACFEVMAYNPELCSFGGKDCFGLYKLGKGFAGFVLNAGIEVARMYPCITIWTS